MDNQEQKTSTSTQEVSPEMLAKMQEAEKEMNSKAHEYIWNLLELGDTFSEEEYEKLDQQYLIKIRKEAYGYRCLTNQKQFYMENYPDVVIENGKIDDLVVMMEEQV